MVKHILPFNEVTLHYTRSHISKLQKVKDPKTCIDIAREYIGNGKLDLKEHYWVFLLTADNRLLGISEFNSGTILASKVFIREIIQLALVANAVGIVLVHNHPSGSILPSKEDFKLTKKLRKIASVMEIDLRDHLIISSESYISLRARMKW